MNTVLVTCYQNPDLDGFACAVGYAEFLTRTGVEAVAGIFGEVHDEVKWLMGKFTYSYPDPVMDPAHFGRVVLVDASTTWGIAPGILPERVIEVYDHRQVHHADVFVHAVLHIESVGAAATLIAEQFFNRRIRPSVYASTILYGAIISNTLNFQAQVTTDRDRRMAVWLNEPLGLPRAFVHEMFLAKSDLAGEKLASRIQSEYKKFSLGGRDISIMQIEMIGVQELIHARLEEIISVMENYKMRDHLDGILFSFVGLEENMNVFVCTDTPMQEVFSSLFGISWQGNIMIRPGLIMRKEIMPLLKKYYEQNT